jgi:UDP-N-acetyl-D-galactosamine dehydrogenase
LNDAYDPWVDPEEARQEYGITPMRKPEARAYDAIIIAVAHDEFKAMGAAALRAPGVSPDFMETRDQPPDQERAAL